MRDYKEQPLQHGEKIPYDEIYDAYINQGLSRTELQEYFNVGRTKIFTTLKEYKIRKSKEQKEETQRQACLRKYGTTHVRKNAEKNAEMIAKAKKTCMEKYGVDCPSKVKEFRDKAKQTTIERYGTTSVCGLPEVQEKMRKKCLEKYGVEHPAQLESVKEKHRKTNLEKFGCESYFQTEEFKEKVKHDNLKKYGVEYASQREDVKEKTKQTNLEKYGCEYSLQNEEVREKGKQTLLDKYGVDNYAKTSEFLEKAKQTCQEKYGVDFASQDPEFRARVTKTNLERFGNICNLSSPEGIQKKTKTWLKNLGVDHPSKSPEVVEKMWKSKKKNGTCSTSKPEDYVYKKLCEKYGYVKRNYKCERYPFHVDFYIPIEDLFIEYQGFEGHGKHPFDYRNKDDVAILLEWSIRADKRKLDRRNKYLAYITTWIERDPLKRNVAKINNLNWLEFFTIEEFENWYKL